MRELENTLQRALAVSAGEVIEGFQLITAIRSGTTNPSGPTITLPIGTTLADAEERVITATLRLCGEDKEKAAKILGISSRTLYRRDAK